ncbi:hypothetical protein SAMN05443287_105316 [Micromonospora phaseoli]|uniref:Uncharacterized protein n=1 Tax=Micromonospora phaseoli TaxID=1144548 RepID=A0A1H6ZXR9_9ACTN|nr:hypothetical protein [Micromonospora phaseoli]PZV96990.1 hypothetical protein CLV64_10697 [Micromonospora phaseoli]GIJ77967.1 hypothetical protein Xph01_23990 [Micromonospora phaseoli]SEJ57436.1 hypothetical protein SAMN05443287_105316 [Micromonospora phaseoli]
MLTVAQVLAQNNFGDTRTGGLAGPMGLFLILVLGAATVLLIRNMNSRLRRLPDRFPTEDAAESEADSAGRTVGDPTDEIVTADSSADSPNGHQQRRDG